MLDVMTGSARIWIASRRNPEIPNKSSELFIYITLTMSRFTAAAGKLTKQIRDEYISQKVAEGKISRNQANTSTILSFTASTDPVNALFFWQLHSLLGALRIRAFITSFYESVLRDHDAPWFRDVFMELGDLEYHVEGQLRFWLDVFAGGRRYELGIKGLHARHRLVKEIMTESGAKRWMHHMKRCMEQYKIEWDRLDQRIVPCLEDFITFFMKEYGVAFEFNVVSWMHQFLISRL